METLRRIARSREPHCIVASVALYLNGPSWYVGGFAQITSTTARTQAIPSSLFSIRIIIIRVFIRDQIPFLLPKPIQTITSRIERPMIQCLSDPRTHFLLVWFNKVDSFFPVLLQIDSSPPSTSFSCYSIPSPNLSFIVLTTSSSKETIIPFQTIPIFRQLSFNDTQGELRQLTTETNPSHHVVP